MAPFIESAHNDFMVSTLWFLIKTCLIVTALLWLFTLEGGVSVNIANYTYESSVGVFIIFMLMIGWIISVIMRAVTVIADAPNQITEYRVRKQKSKGVQSLAYGLSSVAAGDVRTARYHTKQLGKYLKDDFGLGNLLQALTSKLEGDEAQTQKSFHALMDNKETSFLGLKGLLQGALVRGDKAKALDYAEMAYTKNPKQAWVIKTLYNLRIANARFSDAIALLKPAVKYSVLDKDVSLKDKAVLWDADGFLDKALKADPQSLPLILKTLAVLAEGRKRRKSLNLIKKAWGISPHPQLLDYWIKYAPEKTEGNNAAMAAWIEDLYRFNTQSSASALYCGQSLVNLGLEDQAKRFITQAIEGRPTIRAYQLMNQLVPLEGGMDQIAMAKQDQAWICTQTGKIYEAWQMMTSEGYFNTIEWMYPDEVKPVAQSTGEIPFLLAS